MSLPHHETEHFFRMATLAFNLCMLTKNRQRMASLQKKHRYYAHKFRQSLQRLKRFAHGK